MKRQAVAVLLSMLLAPAVVSAQGLQLTGGALAFQAQHHVQYEGLVLGQTGWLSGAEGEVRIGALRIGARGLMGRFAGDADTTNPDRKVRVTAAWLEMSLDRSPLAIGADIEGRRFETALGASVWQLVGGHLRLTQDFGLDGIVTSAEVTLFPIASIPGGGKLALGMRAELGAVFAPFEGPVTLRLSYRIERFDFRPSSAVYGRPSSTRLEQLRGLIFGVGIRLGRRERAGAVDAGPPAPEPQRTP